MKIFQTKVWNWGVHLSIGLSISVMQKKKQKKVGSISFSDELGI